MKRVFMVLAWVMTLPSMAEPPAGSPAPAPAHVSPSVPVPDEKSPSPSQATPVVAWLGVEVTKPDDGVRAQLPELPQGIGFVVRSVDAKGPAASSGLLPYDVIWKMDGQLLVNEGQFATLLRLKSPGDCATFELYRGGKPLIQPVVLVGVPLSGPHAAGSGAENMHLTGDPSSMRVIHPGLRTATLDLTEGKATLRRTDAGDLLEINAPEGGGIFRGVLPPGDDLTPVPAAWRARVALLRKGLAQALDGGLAPVRPPRQRVFLPAHPPAPNPVNDAAAN